MKEARSHETANQINRSRQLNPVDEQYEKSRAKDRYSIKQQEPIVINRNEVEIWRNKNPPHVYELRGRLHNLILDVKRAAIYADYERLRLTIFHECMFILDYNDVSNFGGRGVSLLKADYAEIRARKVHDASV